MKKNSSPQVAGEVSFKKLIVLASGFCGLLVLIAIICVSIMLRSYEDKTDPDHKPGALGGLMNGELLTDPDRVTKEDMEAEYQSRPEITLATQDMLDASLLSYLSRGDFSGLDAFLAEQERTYKNAEGDSAQSIENWQGKFGLLRSDLAAVMNLTKENAAQTFISISNPAILAAAIAYSPVSVKIDAFLDWSAVMFPAVPDSASMLVNMEFIPLPGEDLIGINANSQAKYADIVGYDMTLFGYRCRLIAVMDGQSGYYRPYTLQGIDGHLIAPQTKSDVIELENHLDPYHPLDDVFFVSPFDQVAFDQLQLDHPEWFDAEGNYIAGVLIPPADNAFSSESTIDLGGKVEPSNTSAELP